MYETPVAMYWQLVTLRTADKRALGTFFTPANSPISPALGDSCGEQCLLCTCVDTGFVPLYSRDKPSSGALSLVSLLISMFGVSRTEARRTCTGAQTEIYEFQAST